MSGDYPTGLWNEVPARLRVAESDRQAARRCLARDPPLADGAAFYCEQAAEKLLKGSLVRANIGFRKTHDLSGLAASVIARFPAVEGLARPIERWTACGVVYRHPTESEP